MSISKIKKGTKVLETFLTLRRNLVYNQNYQGITKEENGMKNILETLGIDNSTDFYHVFL